MDIVTNLSQLAVDYVKLAAFVFALVEMFKDIRPDASIAQQKLAAYCGGIAVAAMTIWRPGMAWREYLLLTAYNGVVIGLMAIGGHQTLKRVNYTTSGLPPVPPARKAPDA